MALDNNSKILKEITQNTKNIKSLETVCSKEFLDLKKTFKKLDQKINDILNKIQEFEIVLDTAEALEERLDEQEEKYNTEWNPYDDEDFQPEDYEDYDNYDDNY